MMYAIRDLDKETKDLFKTLKYAKKMSDAELLKFLINYYYKVEAALV